MTKAIIFDFGNVFTNLDTEGFTKNALNHFKINAFSDEMHRVNAVYEKGLISTHTFLEYYLEKIPKLKEEELIDIWNSILKDFPKNRLKFLLTLKKTSKYKLILLSNTNELHIDWIKKKHFFLQ